MQCSINGIILIKQKIITSIEKLKQIHSEAREFTMKHHQSDLEFLKNQSLILNFNNFYKEYCYCVVASGFKGIIASRLAEQLAKCNGEIEQCLKIFKNQQKVGAICKCYQILCENYQQISQQWKSPQDLMSLPYIGPVTCYHLARNIGLQTCVKPDLHMKRLIKQLFGNDEDLFVIETIKQLSKDLNLSCGEVDFALWVFLSHQGNEKECCGGKMRLR